MPKPAQPAPLKGDEERLYSERVPDIQAPHPIAKAESSNRVKETH